jgi:hypothetical protein
MRGTHQVRADLVIPGDIIVRGNGEPDLVVLEVRRSGDVIRFGSADAPYFAGAQSRLLVRLPQDQAVRDAVVAYQAMLFQEWQ